MNVSFFLSAGALVSAGYTADFGPGLIVSAAMQPAPWLSIALEPRLMFPSRAVAQETLDPSRPLLGKRDFDVSNLSAALVPCAHLGLFLVCGVALVSYSIQKSTVLETDATVYALGPRLGLRIPLGSTLALSGFAEALFVPEPAAIAFDDINAVWKQSPISAFFGGALSFKID